MATTRLDHRCFPVKFTKFFEAQLRSTFWVTASVSFTDQDLILCFRQQFDGILIENLFYKTTPVAVSIQKKLERMPSKRHTRKVRPETRDP